MSVAYEGNGVRLQEANDSGDPNDLLITGFIFPDQPNHTIPAFIYKQTKDRVQQLAASCNAPASSKSSTVPFRVADSNTAGQGLFSVENLSPGSLILSERPMFVTRADVLIQISKMETFVQVLFARLPEQDQRTFFNLQNCKSPSETGPLLGRLLTNGITFTPYPNGPNHAGVFPTLAKCNHSCGPNALARFNHATWAIELRATRAIKAGEEILISYVDVLQSVRNRKEQLAKGYNFICLCPWCSLPQSKSAASDARRSEIMGWPESKPIAAVLQSDSDAIATVISRAQEAPQEQEEELTKMIAKVVTATREGLEPFFLLVTVPLFQAYARQGDEKNFRKWRSTFRDLSLAMCGETTDIDRAEREIQEPAATVPYWGNVKTLE